MFGPAHARTERFEAVLFDFGGVITTSPFDGFARYEREAGLPAGLIRQLNSTDPDGNAWARLERSEVSRDEFARLFEAEAAAMGHRLSAAAVLECLKTELRPRMVGAVDRLRATHKTAILTNNVLPDEDTDPVTSPTGDIYAVLDAVDVVVESCRVGVRKPEPRFYEIACDLLGVAPARCVFLDDLGVNLKPARAMGMTTIKVTGADQALAELEAVLGLALR